MNSSFGGSPAVFICYRREDSAGHAGRLFDRIVARIGRHRVFRDVDNIQPGENFIQAVGERVAASTVLLVLIGPRWLRASDSSGRPRLGDPHDLVSLEIVTGLEQKVKTIPVLLEGAAMPGLHDLPAALAPLSHLNAIEIRDSHFDLDASLLIDRIESAGRSGSISRNKTILALACVVFVLAVGVWMYFRLGEHTANGEPSVAPTGDRAAPTGDRAAPSAGRANPPVAPLRDDRRLAETAHSARLQIGQMGLSYEEPVFVRQAKKGDATAVLLFLRAGMRPDACDINCDSTVLGTAAASGHFAIVRTLVEHGASIDRALPDAAQANQPEILEYLLSRKPSKDAMGRALIAATRPGLSAILQKLIERGAGPEYFGKALMLACYYSDPGIVRILLNRGASVSERNSDGEAALHYATRSASRSLEIVQALVQNGANVNAATKDGTTPLMNALGHSEISSFLLEAGADAKAKTKTGDTILMLAAARDLPEMVKSLVARGSDINAQNDDGETALMYASGAVDRVDKPRLVRALLDSGARTDLSDRHGSTALVYAVEQQNSGAVEALIQKGADPGRTNQRGESALSIARKQNRAEILKALGAAPTH